MLLAAVTLKLEIDEEGEPTLGIDVDDYANIVNGKDFLAGMLFKAAKELANSGDEIPFVTREVETIGGEIVEAALGGS